MSDTLERIGVMEQRISDIEGKLVNVTLILDNVHGSLLRLWSLLAQDAQLHIDIINEIKGEKKDETT